MPSTQAKAEAALAREQQEARALEMRFAGASYEQIRQKLGIGSKATAHAVVRRAIARSRAAVRGDLDDLRDLEALRLDRLLQAAWPDAIGRVVDGARTPADTKAMQLVVKLMERRAKLLGLDAPVKTEITGANGAAIQVEDARSALAQKLSAVLGAGANQGPAGES
jgi:hypothetical protein